MNAQVMNRDGSATVYESPSAHRASREATMRAERDQALEDVKLVEANYEILVAQVVKMKADRQTLMNERNDAEKRFAELREERTALVDLALKVVIEAAKKVSA